MMSQGGEKVKSWRIERKKIKKTFSPARKRGLPSRDKFGHTGLPGGLALERRQGGRRAEQCDAGAVLEFRSPTRSRRLRSGTDRQRRRR